MKKKLKIKSYCPPIVANILDKSYLIYNNGTSIQWVDVPYNYDWTTEFEYKELNPKITRSIVYKKTITVFEVSFVFGWLFGGGSIDKLSSVKKAAWHFGMAFQMQDDIDDIEQDNKKNRTINFASLFGIEKTSTMFFQEVNSLKKSLRSLNLYSKEFSDFIFSLVKNLKA